MKTNKPGYKWFRRPCDKCGILFVRTGKFHKVCERCKKLTYKKHVRNGEIHPIMKSGKEI